MPEHLQKELVDGNAVGNLSSWLLYGREEFASPSREEQSYGPSFDICTTKGLKATLGELLTDETVKLFKHPPKWVLVRVREPGGWFKSTHENYLLPVRIPEGSRLYADGKYFDIAIGEAIFVAASKSVYLDLGLYLVLSP